MNILVTGSSGTIGTRLCERLLADGRNVKGVDWVPNKWNPSINSITTIADMRSAEEMKKIPSDVDTIVHLAANARVYDLVTDPLRALDNITTLFNALEFARKHGIKRFLFSSSREVYGNTSADTYDESMVHVEHCESPYTASKLGGEAFVEAYTRCYGIDHVIFRFSNVYGMYDDSDRVVPLFIRRAKAGQPLTIFGEGKCLDFTYIDDTVDGIVRAIERFDDAKNATYNLAYGQGTTITRLAERVKELLGSSSEITMSPPRTGEVTHYVADISKARSMLGYQPAVSFDEGIQKSVEWYGGHDA